MQHLMEVDSTLWKLNMAKVMQQNHKALQKTILHKAWLVSLDAMKVLLQEQEMQSRPLENQISLV